MVTSILATVGIVFRRDVCNACELVKRSWMCNGIQEGNMPKGPEWIPAKLRSI